MQIQVTQREIDAGLLTYLKSRGFNDLDLSRVTITYTQGRKGSGLTATLVEIDASGFDQTKSVAADPAASAVEILKEQGNLPPNLDPVPEPEPEPEPEPTPEPVPEAGEENTQSGASLFGNA